MATVKEAFKALHQANTGEDPEELEFDEGEEVEIISEFQYHYLVRKGSGEVFNVPKDKIEPD
jgi:hypothetical protein